MKVLDWIGWRKPLQLTGHIYVADKHRGWGDSIRWLDYDKRIVVGHLQRRPEVGDEIVFKMKSGKIASYGVTSVEYMSNPPDMFFCNVMDIGYAGESPINKVKRAKL